MPGYTHIKAADFEWKENALGLESAQFEGNGMILSIVRVPKGRSIEPHTHSKGSYMYLVSGKLNVDGKILEAGDAGKCDPGSGHYPMEALEDATYVVCRPSGDEIIKS